MTEATQITRSGWRRLDVTARAPRHTQSAASGRLRQNGKEHDHDDRTDDDAGAEGPGGEYYLLPQEVLEQCRVPAEHKAEVERLVAEAHDVSGHLEFADDFFRQLLFFGVIRAAGQATHPIAGRIKESQRPSAQ